MLYALLHQNIIIGLYSNLSQCKLMMKGLLLNKFTNINSIKITSYYDNSIVLTNDNVDINSEEDTSDIIESFSDETTTDSLTKGKNTKDTKEKEKKKDKKEKTEKMEEKKNEIKKNEIFIATDELDSVTRKKIKKHKNRQSKIEYNMTLIKQKKEKLEESQNIYKTDFELFKKFKKIIIDTPNFTIPELFQGKFKLMLELEKLNNLSWETFHANYKKDKITTSHSTLFEVENEKTNERELLEISSDEIVLPNTMTTVATVA